MKRHSSWPERLKWAEDIGLKNLQEKFVTADNISKEAQTTLTYIFAGMGGVFVYILPGLQRPLDMFLSGALLLGLHFVVLGLYLARKAFFISDYPSPYQEAKNLLERPDLSIDDVREGEILNMADRLVESKTWIEKKSKAINVVRLYLILSPIAFLAGCLLFKLFG